MDLLSARLQEMMGLGLPVAMHSRMAFWCSDTEMFCGPAMMRGLWGGWGLGTAEGDQKQRKKICQKSLLCFERVNQPFKKVLGRLNHLINPKQNVYYDIYSRHVFCLMDLSPLKLLDAMYTTELSDKPGMTVRVASALRRRLAMLVAMQR